MNKVILLGRLTKEPEVRYTEATNNTITKFTLAVNRKYAKQGEERQTDFINIVAWNKIADTASKYLKKGMQVIITGRMQTRVWTDDNQVKHYVTEVICEEIDFVGGKNVQENVEEKDTPEDVQNEIEDAAEEVLSGDDLPF